MESPNTEISLRPAEGWHCTHFFYRFDRAALRDLSEAEKGAARENLVAALNPAAATAPARLQTSLVVGHKADFGLMVLDADPLRVQGVHQQLLSGPMGPIIEPVYSFVSLTEVSEYVPTPDQYAAKLAADGEDPESPSYKARVKAYSSREEAMRRQRLEPELPPWPATCFYPMNKKRKVGENWFSLPFEERTRMMGEHGRTGMTFGGKVTQLITVGIGLDDWEWGVTLWARNPAFLKDIVYRMRFDEASARYAEFGPFYTSYVTTPAEMLVQCRV